MPLGLSGNMSWKTECFEVLRFQTKTDTEEGFLEVGAGARSSLREQRALSFTAKRSG